MLVARHSGLALALDERGLGVQRRPGGPGTSWRLARAGQADALAVGGIGRVAAVRADHHDVVVETAIGELHDLGEQRVRQLRHVRGAQPFERVDETRLAEEARCRVAPRSRRR